MVREAQRKPGGRCRGAADLQHVPLAQVHARRRGRGERRSLRGQAHQQLRQARGCARALHAPAAAQHGRGKGRSGGALRHLRQCQVRDVRGCGRLALPARPLDGGEGVLERGAQRRAAGGRGRAPCPAPVATRELSFEGNNAWASAAADWLETNQAAKTHASACKTLKELLEEDVSRAFGHGIEAKRSKAGAITIKELK